ncbi:Benzoylformate decarboxylase [Symmachiella macrocystis]|uniref:Benzoylformate decarboxylase n=1 Tax=Symmachiella macrocystis TaxID=2527985 RepID=A0A5C6AZK0_9PLAN|nr:thiamine pyrophosphate-binding protein [Symmachiella macrocystis]TWU05140.1 Benzoylformate decarboxylase [Symmachiella macrocystis]
MKEQLQQYLRGELSRRGFVQSLLVAGFTAVAADQVAASAAAVAEGKTGAGRTVSGSGGKLMVEQMRDAGVRYLFTNPGSFEVGLFDACLGREGLQLIVGLHEGLVIAMADGYHKASGKPGFVNVHTVAGTAQAAGQMYNASRDRSVLIVTAGMIDNETFSDNLLLGARPGFGQKEINRQFTKLSWDSHDAAGLPVMLRRAFKVATTAPQGPVYLAVPNTVLEKPNVTARVYPWEQFILPDEIPPNDKLVKHVAEKLLNARSPLLVVGDEIAKMDAHREALEFAELLDIPVAHPRRCVYHNFPRRHRLYAGEYWVEREKDSARSMFAGHDLVINCGALDVGGRSIPEKSIYDRDATVVCIGLDTSEIGRTQRFDVAMIANPKLALRGLIDELLSSTTQQRRAKTVAKRRPIKPWSTKLQHAPFNMSPMHPDQLGWTLEEMLDKNAIIVSENITGSNQFFSTGCGEDDKLWIGNTSSGLGWGLGAATGAKLGQPDRQVVCNIGDGSLMYSAAGFWTQARYGIPVLTVVCNNRNYQTVRNAYVEYGGQMVKKNQFTGTYLGDPEIDFVKLAQSQGVEGTAVEHPSELKDAIQRGIDATREGAPYILDVNVRCIGVGADSKWHQRYSLADERKQQS